MNRIYGPDTLNIFVNRTLKQATTASVAVLSYSPLVIILSYH